MEKKIKVSKDGPYLVTGNIPLDKEYIDITPDGFPLKWDDPKKYPDQDSYALCRCGNSKNKPFCDSTHLIIPFDGTETAAHDSHLDKAKTYEGPELTLKDNEKLCSSAQFCDRAGGIWNTIKSEDPEFKKITMEMASNCPSGRLVIFDKDGKSIEPKFEPNITATEDPDKSASGPLWVKGYVSIESNDGYEYEKRNRVTLCRCGQSHNKPFCDTSHLRFGFNDGDEGLAEKIKIIKEKLKKKWF